MEQSKKDGVWMIDVVFDGKSLSDFGAYIFPVDVDKRAERRYEEVEIEGRNGLYDDDLKTFRNLDEPVYALISQKMSKKICLIFLNTFPAVAVTSGWKIHFTRMFI